MQGFSLLEVMISLILLSMTFLGLNTMQFYAFQQIQVNYLFAEAVNQVGNFSERLQWVHSADSVTEQFTRWNEENKRVLPNGLAEIEGFFPNYTLTLYWGHFKKPCLKNTMGAAGCLIENIQV